MHPGDTESGLSVELLRKHLHYNPETGEWTWLISQSNVIQAGTHAGCITDRGYLRIRFKGNSYYSARLAWFYMTGEWPKEQIDHANRDRLDDRWNNLREATWSDNMANRKLQGNNTSGFKGVSWDKVTNKWDVRVNRFHIGYYDSLEEAVAVRDATASNLQGEFAALNSDQELKR